ncbi:MAG: hypothetical protein ACK441_07730, partial [Burkholderiales bacterium]
MAEGHPQHFGAFPKGNGQEKGPGDNPSLCVWWWARTTVQSFAQRLHATKQPNLRTIANRVSNTLIDLILDRSINNILERVIFRFSLGTAALA